MPLDSVPGANCGGEEIDRPRTSCAFMYESWISLDLEGRVWCQANRAYTIRGLAVNDYFRTHATTTGFRCVGESSEVPIKHAMTLSLDRFQPGLGPTFELLQIQAIKPAHFDSWQHENLTNLSETRG